MKEIIKNFLEKETGHQISNFDVNLIETGVIDSFSMIKLIDFLEKKFGVEFDMEDLSHKNFNSVSSMCEFIKNLKNHGNTTN